MPVKKLPNTRAVGRPRTPSSKYPRNQRPSRGRSTSASSYKGMRKSSHKAIPSIARGLIKHP